MNTLGVPDEYEVFIVDSLSQDTVGVVPWTSINWQRMKNGASRATVACARQKGIRPGWYDIAPPTAWGNMLVIQRDGLRVWDGPIIGWSSGQNLTIEAADRSAALAKRLITGDIVLDPDLGQIGDMWVDVLSPTITASGLTTAGVGQMPYTMTLNPQLQDIGTGPPGGLAINVQGTWRFANLITLQALFDEFADTGFFCWTQVNDALTMFISNLPATFTKDLRTEYIHSDAGDIGVTVRGDSLVTGVYRGDTGQGVAGFPNPYVGSDDQTYVPYGLYGVLPDANTGAAVFNNEAIQPVDPKQYLDAAPVPTLEDVQLSPEFPCDEGMTDIIPGMLFRLDFPDSWGLNTGVLTVAADTEIVVRVFADTIQYARLEQLDVSVVRSDSASAELTETVKASLTAWSWESA